MAISDPIRSAPKLFFVTFIFLCLGGLFLLTAIASPNWLVGIANGVAFSAGLWTVCTIQACTSIPAIGIYIAIRALSMLALLGAGGCGLAALACVVLEQRRQPLAYLVAIGCLLSCLSNMVTVILYSINANVFGAVMTLSWSFILACLGSFCLFTASVTGFVVACKRQSFPDQTRLT